jgi:hypothetical protein
MPRNDQVTRQWHLIRHLETTARGATLQELAAGLSAEYRKHLRTIRRDLEALKAAGFPLLTERGEGRWRREGLTRPRPSARGAAEPRQAAAHGKRGSSERQMLLGESNKSVAEPASP